MEIYLGLISTEMYHLVRRNFSEQLVGFSNSYRVSHSATKFNVCVCVLLCWTLWDTLDCSRPGSSIQGILQARILGWIAISHSGNLPDQEMEPGSPVAPVLTSRIFTNAPTGAPLKLMLFAKCIIYWRVFY